MDVNEVESPGKGTATRGGRPPAAVFEEIAGGLMGEEPAIESGTGFGSSPGLRFGGRIFAMLVRGEFVVKLPGQRCTQLVASGEGRPFDRGQ
ncbi:MAG: hypothetical protein JWM85_38, partial [Acidimicrobiaceae bacterium]|nr:hypothetical protein [Acidimicrobiaceae bacterium]